MSNTIDDKVENKKKNSSEDERISNISLYFPAKFRFNGDGKTVFDESLGLKPGAYLIKTRKTYDSTQNEKSEE